MKPPMKPAPNPALITTAVAAVLCACSTPTPSIQLRFSEGPTQRCPATACEELPMPCDSVVNIQVLDPKTPTTPYISECVLLEGSARGNLCSLESVRLTEKPLPVSTLEVRVAVYPAAMAVADPLHPETLSCPNVEFTRADFPVDTWPTPALGGRAFYNPGDSIVEVTLGCTHLASLEEACVMPKTIKVNATVDDFETMTPVTGGPFGTASRLRVSVGEPREVDGRFEMKAEDSPTLAQVGGTVPSWSSDVGTTFAKFICVDVLETVAQTTAAVRCKSATDGPEIDVSGMRISKEQLQKILSAMATPAPPAAFPEEGLTIGIVVDENALPLPGITVTSQDGTVRYLDNQGRLTGGSTSNSGIFISRDAPFGTEFSTGPSRASGVGIGGLIAGKITVVVLQHDTTP